MVSFDAQVLLHHGRVQGDRCGRGHGAQFIRLSVTGRRLIHPLRAMKRQALISDSVRGSVRFWRQELVNCVFQFGATHRQRIIVQRILL